MITTTACITAWVVALIALPLIVILWATESRPQRVRRMRSYGMSHRAIAERIGCHRTTVGRILAAS